MPAFLDLDLDSWQVMEWEKIRRTNAQRGAWGFAGARINAPEMVRAIPRNNLRQIAHD